MAAVHYGALSPVLRYAVRGFPMLPVSWRTYGSARLYDGTTKADPVEFPNRSEKELAETGVKHGRGKICNKRPKQDQRRS